MRTPLFRIDFNEMLDEDLVLFSTSDSKTTLDGRIVALYEGLEVAVTEEDFDDAGRPDNLVATGRVETNTTTGWGAHVKWCCRIDARGIHHQSEID